MAHELEFDEQGARMFFTGETPWHREGVAVKGALTSAEALRTARMDWTVEKYPLFLADGRQLSDRVAVLRDDGAHVGTVGLDYTLVQNRDAFDWCDTMLGGGAIYETAGVLQGGRKVWLMCKMPQTVEPVPGDPTQLFVLIVNSHDGSMALGCHITPVRSVCMNTVRAAVANSERSFKIYHRSGIAARMEEGARALGLVSRYTALFEEAMRGLAARAVTWPLTETFIDRMIPLPAEEGRGHTLAERGREKLLELVEAGKGANIPGVRGTAYGLWQAAAEYADHWLPSRGDEQTRAENRLVSMTLTGSRLQFKDKALEVVQAL